MRSGAIRPRVLPPGSLALGSFTRRFRWDRRLSQGSRLSLIPRLALGWGLSLGFRLNPGRRLGLGRGLSLVPRPSLNRMHSWAWRYGRACRHDRQDLDRLDLALAESRQPL